MIVCSCNVLTEVEIRASIATLKGPRRVCDVYASLGCAARCGGCAGTICALINETEGRRFDAELTGRGREAGGVSRRDCEGHRHAPSATQNRDKRAAESPWRIAAATDAALELTAAE
jgi:bacterioferritin-associated ferredoxin